MEDEDHDHDSFLFWAGWAEREREGKIEAPKVRYRTIGPLLQCLQFLQVIYGGTYICDLPFIHLHGPGQIFRGPQQSQRSGAPYTLLPRTVLDISTDGVCSLE